MEFNSFTLIILLAVPVFTATYLIMPKIYLYVTNNAYMKEISSKNESVFQSKLQTIPIAIKYKKKIIETITKAGIENQKELFDFLFLTILIPLFVSTIIYLKERNFSIIICMLALIIVLPQMILSSKIEKRNRAFVFNAYKIYYFLHSQISSGIKPTDAILGIYEIVQNPLIKNTFVKFVAQYELTLDVSKSLTIIQNSFKGYDAEMMCVCIKQCIDSGKAGKTLLKMEEKMFSKYFSYLQKETVEYKTKLVICAIFAIIPIGIIFIGPMIYEAMQGINSIMSIS